MNKADKRAIRITELTEQLDEAKSIIERFVWPPDCTEEEWQQFKQQAARLAGCTVPQYYNPKPEQNESPATVV